MKQLSAILGLSIVLLFPARPVFCDSPEKQRRIQDQKRKALQETEHKLLALENRLVFDYGGWTDFRHDEFSDQDNDSSSRDVLEGTSSFDFRFWIKATLRPRVEAEHQNEHSLYLRYKNIFSIREPDDVLSRYDKAGPPLDQGYLVLDMRPWWVEIGRRYYMVGQGIAYGNVHDGVELNANFTDWNFKTFYAHSLPREDNVDLSAPGSSRSDRNFYGFEGRYLGLPGGHSVYGFYLLQRDRSDEDPIDLTAEYTYDSEYIGTGLQGKLFPKAHYWVEVVRERGESRVFATGEKRPVKAWAGDFGVTYDLDAYSHPNFTVEYAFGSGDDDRANVTDTQNGNTTGRDKNFLYFGYLPTGYAVSLRLSNIHFYKAGVLLNPLERFDALKDLKLGVDYYRFYKDEKRGGVSDTDATLLDRDIGAEIDLTLSWQILSDVSLTFEYGYFMPGDAYPSFADDSEQYFSADVTLTF